jgi:hypothetical protein
LSKDARRLKVLSGLTYRFALASRLLPGAWVV